MEHCAVIVNYNNLTEEYGQWSLDGYEIPTEGTAEEPQTGLKSWPSIFAFPTVSTLEIHSLISILNL